MNQAENSKELNFFCRFGLLFNEGLNTERGVLYESVFKNEGSAKNAHQILDSLSSSEIQNERKNYKKKHYTQNFVRNQIESMQRNNENNSEILHYDLIIFHSV